jgi:DNA-binding GntR family transcriptional regulator
MAAKLGGPVTVTDFVTRSIRERILAGEYPPGTKLDQHRLVNEFGASLIPVRESLRQLESQGFIRLYPHRGAFVADVSLAELQEIYLIRETLEELATRLAVPLFTEADVVQLSALESELSKAIGEHAHERILDLSMEFCFTIYNASQKPLLCQVIRGLWDRAQIYRQLTVHMPAHLRQAVRNYRAILRAIKQGDADAAAHTVRRNLHQTVLSFIEYFDDKDVKQAIVHHHQHDPARANGAQGGGRKRG